MMKALIRKVGVTLLYGGTEKYYKEIIEDGFFIDEHTSFNDSD